MSMNIKKWTNDKGRTYKINSWGMDMTTISFERNITLDEVGAKKLLTILSPKNDKLNEFQYINVEEKLAGGKYLLNRLFSY